jgi:hypothetical protein
LSDSKGEERLIIKERRGKFEKRGETDPKVEERLIPKERETDPKGEECLII